MGAAHPPVVAVTGAERGGDRTGYGISPRAALDAAPEVRCNARVKKPAKLQKFVRRHYLFAVKDEAAFQRFQEIMDDGELWSSYPEWCENLNRSVETYTRQGTQVEKIEVHPDEFVAWCKLHHRKHDSNSRSQYAAYKGGEMNAAEN
jgi:hypothetical protein